jgi:hypothetical protein
LNRQAPLIREGVLTEGDRVGNCVDGDMHNRMWSRRRNFRIAGRPSCEDFLYPL